MAALSRSELKRGMRNSIREGMLSDAGSSMRSSDFITAFALFLGAGAEIIGIASALPRLFRIFSLLFTGRIMGMFKSLKKATTLFAILSRAVWLPVLFVPYIGAHALLALILMTCAAAAFSEVSGAIWTSWMCDLVPEKARGRYFGRRNMMTIGASTAATMLAGWVLGLYNSAEGFILVFGASIALSLASNYFLSKVPDVEDRECFQKVRFSMKRFARGITEHKNYSNYVVLMTLLYFSTSLVGPFFAVRMLRDLGFGYFWFSAVIASEILTMMFAEPYWGRMSDRFGDRTIMKLSYMMIPVVPLLWIFVTQPWQGMAIGVLSGFAWAGFEISSFNYLLACAPKKGQPVFIANYKVFFNVGTFLGPIAGGLMLVMLGSAEFLALSGIQMLFLTSFALRALFAGLTLPRIGEVRVRSSKPFLQLFINSLTIYPASSVRHELVYVGRCMHCWEKKVFKGVRGAVI
ncbi:MAG: MFS transporter [Candidatus Aenigmatarchaeota archaeon]